MRFATQRSEPSTMCYVNVSKEGEEYKKRMEHEVFYGDYSLKHWIDLMLEGRIVIPEFQRDFVWDKEDIHNLMESFKNNSFIPPVMIGAYDKDGNNKNNSKIDDWIIDGQQRLSSILLAWLDIYPPKKKGNNANESEENKWDFEKIQAEVENITKNFKITDRESLRRKIAENLKGQEEYSELKLGLSNPDDVFSKCRLGFSYIKPDGQTKHEEQKKFYAELFRNINTTGVDLTNMEAREALYWISELKEFFAPNFTKNIKVDEKPLDFARILALLSEYKKCGSFDKLAEKYSKKFETYIVLYIESAINKKDEKFDISVLNVIKNGMEDYNKKIEKIKNYIGERGSISVIEADYDLFGLVYFILFENKDINTLDTLKKDELKIEIGKEKNKKPEEYKSKEKNAPYGLTYMRNRIKESIEIYKKVYGIS